MCFLKKLDDRGSPKRRKIVSANLRCALFCLLGFLTLEAGTIRLSRNVGMELPLYTV